MLKKLLQKVKKVLLAVKAAWADMVPKVSKVNPVSLV